MRIKRIEIKDFKRFAHLKIEELPETARLVVLAGPNGFGKSSLFEAFFRAYFAYSNTGLGWDPLYHSRSAAGVLVSPVIEFHTPVIPGPQNKHLFYFRTAYRHDPDVRVGSIERLGPATEERRFDRLSQNDVSVTQNMKRMVGAIVEDVAANENEATTFREYRDRMFGDIAKAMATLFPDLRFDGFRDPLTEGTFFFTKGVITRFRYSNLSGGEKAAFDLILDLAVKGREFYDSIYCIDEPELHLNASIHGKLLDVLLSLVQCTSQLWLATHSIGMMRRAIEIERSAPGSVVFMDFANQDFDNTVVLRPVRPTRTFWLESLRVALDDLAELVAPSEVIVCEGSVAGKNADHDATCYNEIFSQEQPETQFVSGGNSYEVTNDRLKFVEALPSIIKGIKVRKLIDRDDHAVAEVARLRETGVLVLDKRNIEAYLWDDEVLEALCSKLGRLGDLPAVLEEKRQALEKGKAAGGAPDDMKAASGFAYVAIKRSLALTGVGNTSRGFERETLAPLIRPGMTVYKELKAAIFG